VTVEFLVDLDSGLLRGEPTALFFVWPVTDIGQSQKDCAEVLSLFCACQVFSVLLFVVRTVYLAFWRVTKETPSKWRPVFVKKYLLQF